MINHFIDSIKWWWFAGLCTASHLLGEQLIKIKNEKKNSISIEKKLKLSMTFTFYGRALTCRDLLRQFLYFSLCGLRWLFVSCVLFVMGCWGFPSKTKWNFIVDSCDRLHRVLYVKLFGLLRVLILKNWILVISMWSQDQVIIRSDWQLNLIWIFLCCKWNSN